MKNKLLISLGILFSWCCSVLAAPTYYHVTAAGAGAKTGASWATAMGYAEWETSMEALTTETDYYYFVQAGTYTLTSDFTVNGDGTSALFNHVIGVKAATTNEGASIVYSDYGQGADRPLITDGASAYTFSFDDFWDIQNIRMTGSDTDCIVVDYGSKIINCYASNDGASKNSLRTGAGGLIANSEGISANGTAIVLGGHPGVAYGNYAHDSTTGISVWNGGGCIFFNIIDTCSTTGILLTTTKNIHHIIHNTIYNCPTGINGVSTTLDWVIGNIIDTCTTDGVSFDTATGTAYSDYNNWNGNTGGDTTNFTKGNHEQAVDPQFEAAATGDFEIGANLDDDGPTPPGTTMSSAHLEIGAAMYEETAGGGTGGGASFFSMN